jgi:YbbR domain-containing protein
LKETRKTTERGLLARMVLENYPLKLLAMGLAVALYLFVHDDDSAQRQLNCDVVATLPPSTANRVLTSDPPRAVQLTLRGPRSRLIALKQTDFEPIQMDLRTYDQAMYVFDARSIALPNSVQLVQISPSRVPLSWQPRAQREVPVRVELIGQLRRGLDARVLDVAGASSVVISGPRAAVDHATGLVTHEANVAGLLAGTHSVSTVLKPLADHLSYVTTPEPNVRVEVRPVSETVGRAP